MPLRRLEPGEVIGGFQLEAPVHAGAMAQLWRVAGAEAASPLLMKIPLLRHGENPASIVGFEVEQMILPTLSGIHVPRFVAAGDFNEPYIVMELISGQSLKARLPDLPLPPGEVAAIGAKLAIALHELPRQRAIHYLGSVSSRVVAEAPCTVTVVRTN